MTHEYCVIATFIGGIGVGVVLTLAAVLWKANRMERTWHHGEQR